MRKEDEEKELEELATKEKDDEKKQKVAFIKSPVAEIVNKPVKKIKKPKGEVPVISKDAINKDTLSDKTKMKKIKLKKIAGGS